MILHLLPLLFCSFLRSGAILSSPVSPLHCADPYNCAFRVSGEHVCKTATLMTTLQLSSVAYCGLGSRWRAVGLH
jgi:hypothetical protein